jgi:hypothetical protein
MMGTRAQPRAFSTARISSVAPQPSSTGMSQSISTSEIGACTDGSASCSARSSVSLSTAMRPFSAVET